MIMFLQPYSKFLGPLFMCCVANSKWKHPFYSWLEQCKVHFWDSFSWNRKKVGGEFTVAQHICPVSIATFIELIQYDHPRYRDYMVKWLIEATLIIFSFKMNLTKTTLVLAIVFHVQVASSCKSESRNPRLIRNNIKPKIRWILSAEIS